MIARRVALGLIAIIFATHAAATHAAPLGAQSPVPPQSTTVTQPVPPAGPVPCPLVDASCLPPTTAREFRGLWIASVGNLDWPSRPGLPPDVARRELRELLDRAKASGLNAVIFQVRPAGDALYGAALEPWSEYLTGRQGVAPKPWWDPLAYAVAESHRRGLELHAWFNPYRARHPTARGPFSARHVAMLRPELVRNYGRQKWMDPGHPAVRAQTVRVVLDVVRRYDIDGVHIDDYFYPYRERDARGRLIEFPDEVTYRAYRASGGELERNDWRRENVNTLVRELYTEIHNAKPWVKFGVSPFGIWRPGFPESVVGFDAYHELYADARKWLQEGWLDYFSPQLYWSVTKVGQEYPLLLRWWAEQNAFGRHLWPGNYTANVGGASRSPWRSTEIERQILATRAEAGASGNVHFSASVFLQNRDSIATHLRRTVYRLPALVPPSPWLGVTPQGEPTVHLTRAANGTWNARVTAATAEMPRWWLVQTRLADGVWRTALLSGSLRDLPISAAADRVAVRAVDRAAIESPMVVIRVR